MSPGREPRTIKLIENPRETEPVLLDRASIPGGRSKSPTSIMPKGLLDKLTPEEILDLIAYIAARGDSRASLFHGDHEHGH